MGTVYSYIDYRKLVVLITSINNWFPQVTTGSVSSRLVPSVHNWFRQFTTGSVSSRLVPSVYNWFRQLTTGSVTYNDWLCQLTTCSAIITTGSVDKQLVPPILKLLMLGYILLSLPVK